MPNSKRTNTILKTIIGNMRLSNQLIQQVKERVVPYGINASEFSVLEFLLHKGDQPIQVIAKRVLLSSGSMTYVVDNLVKKGWVERKISASDKRSFTVSLTEAGKELIENLFPVHKENVAKLFSALSDEELAELQRLLKKLA